MLPEHSCRATRFAGDMLAPAAAVQFGASTLSTSPISSRPRRASIISTSRSASAGDASSRAIFLFAIVQHDNKRAVDQLYTHRHWSAPARSQGMLPYNSRPLNQCTCGVARARTGTALDKPRRRACAFKTATDSRDHCCVRCVLSLRTSSAAYHKVTNQRATIKKSKGKPRAGITKA